MTSIINDSPSSQRQLIGAQQTGMLLLILSVLAIGYLSMLNVQQGIREYRHLSQETMPVIDSLEGLKFSSMRIVASVSELGMITRMEVVSGTEKDAAMTHEERYLEQGFEQFNQQLYRYRELVLRYFPLEVPNAERLFHEGEKFRRLAQILQAAILEGEKAQELLQLKEEMESSEGRFLSLATEILEHEANEVSQRDEVITHSLERQIWMLWFGGLFLIGLAAFQRWLRLRLCTSCSRGASLGILP